MFSLSGPDNEKALTWMDESSINLQAHQASDSSDVLAQSYVWFAQELIN